MRDSIVKPTSHSHMHDKARGPNGYFEMMFSELIQTGKCPIPQDVTPAHEAKQIMKMLRSGKSILHSV